MTYCQVIELGGTANEHKLTNFHDFLYDFLGQPTGLWCWLLCWIGIKLEEKGEIMSVTIQLLIEQT
jgi:hypothetical protein